VLSHLKLKQVLLHLHRTGTKVVHSVLCDMTETFTTGSVDLTCLIDLMLTLTLIRRQRPQTIEMAQLILYGGYDFEPTIINPSSELKPQHKWQWMSKPFPNRSWAKNMNTTQERT